MSTYLGLIFYILIFTFQIFVRGIQSAKKRRLRKHLHAKKEIKCQRTQIRRRKYSTRDKNFRSTIVISSAEEPRIIFRSCISFIILENIIKKSKNFSNLHFLNSRKHEIWCLILEPSGPENILFESTIFRKNVAPL